MDLNEYWQENKRFVLTVVCGVVAFLIGLYAVDSVYGTDLKAARATESRHRRDLRQPMYTRSAQDLAEEENDQLRAAVRELAQAVAFRTRPGFVLRPGAGSASAQYHEIVGRVRDELRPAAARVNLRLEETLGLPKLSPTVEGEIERYLEALDVIERVARRAIAHRVERLEDVRIQLDPSLTSRAGVGRVERTKIELSLRGSAVALLRVIADLQRPAEGAPILVHRLEMLPSRGREDEARLDLILVVARLHEIDLGEAS